MRHARGPDDADGLAAAMERLLDHDARVVAADARLARAAALFLGRRAPATAQRCLPRGVARRRRSGATR